MASDPTLRLRELETQFAVVRLAAADAWPTWALASPFCSLTRTDRELSVVVDAAAVPAGLPHVQRGWRAIGICGALPFDLVGVLKRLLDPLAAAGIAIFSISTYDTDWLLIHEERLAAARVALRAAGFVWDFEGGEGGGGESTVGGD